MDGQEQRIGELEYARQTLAGILAYSYCLKDGDSQPKPEDTQIDLNNPEARQYPRRRVGFESALRTAIRELDGIIAHLSERGTENGILNAFEYMERNQT